MGDPRFLGTEQRRRMGAESSHLGMTQRPDQGSGDGYDDRVAANMNAATTDAHVAYAHGSKIPHSHEGGPLDHRHVPAAPTDRPSYPDEPQEMTDVLGPRPSRSHR